MGVWVAGEGNVQTAGGKRERERKVGRGKREGPRDREERKCHLVPSPGITAADEG